jgi:hypothetical protein
MHELEDRIEDWYVDAMDIIDRAIGREDGTRFSRVFGAMRAVAVAAVGTSGIPRGA